MLILLVNRWGGHVVIVYAYLLKISFQKLAGDPDLAVIDANVQPIVVLKILHKCQIILIVNDANAHVRVMRVEHVVFVAIVAAFFVLVHHLVLELIDGGQRLDLFTVMQDVGTAVFILICAKAGNRHILLHAGFASVTGVRHVGLFPVCHPVGYPLCLEYVLCMCLCSLVGAQLYRLQAKVGSVLVYLVKRVLH